LRFQETPLASTGKSIEAAAEAKGVEEGAKGWHLLAALLPERTPAALSCPLARELPKAAASCKALWKN
jgi:hypothetical protein